MSRAIEDALNAVLPIDEWERNDFEYIGTHVRVSLDGVHITQSAYAASRNSRS